MLIYDKILAKKSKAFRQWMKSFDLSYGVQAGEELKAVENFPKHIQHLVKLCENTSSRRLTLVVAGGGSVGDFGGFVASILKRGVGLVHVPSTWLAAIDSAHGGKTALNVAGSKNQIGTFYPAKQTVLVKDLLLAQPEERSFEAFSELIKIALLEGGEFWRKLRAEKEVTSEMVWRYLPQAIAGKMRIVNKDPQEKSGHRHLLNFGHTVGHVFEAYYELPHGIAINYGLDFALKWSARQGILSAKAEEEIRTAPVSAYLLSAERDELLSARESVLKKWNQLLLQDKKKNSSRRLRFIFMKKVGQPVIKEVSVDEILMELCRQKEDELHD
ncbi:hypothetical protein [Bdellovibrio sp. HCB2-146]|uniref:3-dehydroquinate synthase family protein n=1 Tax=Bdellovibrio sp. HCB2-146 TaxID=3394362 RepID=UPI0039BD41CD